MKQSIKKISLAALVAVGINGSTPTMTITPENAIMGVVGAFGLTYIAIATKNELALQKKNNFALEQALRKYITGLKETIQLLEQNPQSNQAKLKYFKTVLHQHEARLSRYERI